MLLSTFIRKGLFHVPGDEFRHLKHRNLLLAAKDRQKLLIGDDIALVLRVLKIVLLDVDPDLLHDLSAGHRAFADHLLKFG